MDNRATKGSSKIILSLFRLWKRWSDGAVEPVVGIEYVIPKIIEQHAVKLIRARTRQYRNLCSGRAAELRSKSRCLYTELLQCVNRDQTICSTDGIERTEAASKPTTSNRSGTDSDIRADSIHHPIIRATALTVHTELARIVSAAWCNDDSRRELNQSLKTSAIHRQVFAELSIHDSAHRGGLSVDQRSATFDCHRLTDIANLHGEIHRNCVGNVKSDTRFDDDFEAALGHRKFVISGTEVRKVVDAIPVRLHCCFNSSVNVLRGNRRFDDCRSIRIKHSSRYTCQYGLRRSRSAQPKSAKKSAGEETRHLFLLHVWDHLAFETASPLFLSF